MSLEFNTTQTEIKVYENLLPSDYDNLTEIEEHAFYIVKNRGVYKGNQLIAGSTKQIMVVPIGNMIDEHTFNELYKADVAVVKYISSGYTVYALKTNTFDYSSLAPGVKHIEFTSFMNFALFGWAETQLTLLALYNPEDGYAAVEEHTRSTTESLYNEVSFVNASGSTIGFTHASDIDHPQNDLLTAEGKIDNNTMHTYRGNGRPISSTVYGFDFGDKSVNGVFHIMSAPYGGNATYASFGQDAVYYLTVDWSGNYQVVKKPFPTIELVEVDDETVDLIIN